MDPAVINLYDAVDGYVDLAKHVLRYGNTVSPRGQETREIEDAVIRITNVRDTLPLGVGRNVVPGIGAVEACQLLAGVSMPELVVAVGPQFKKYTEDNGLFHGAYGLRTNMQYEKIIERLKDDPDTRQAVVTIWDPKLDLLNNKRDYPCTILHQFKIRNDALNMSVYMRSNDVWLGAAYDFFQFTRVQLAIASILGISPGTYTHHVGSLHIYEQHYDLVDNLKYANSSSYVPYIQGDTWAQVRLTALGALDAAITGVDVASGAQWYATAMQNAIANHKKQEKVDSKL